MNKHKEFTGRLTQMEQDNLAHEGGEQSLNTEGTNDKLDKGVRECRWDTINEKSGK